MNALATIHIAKKQLRLDDDTYRAVLLRVTGKVSSRDMGEGERQAVVDEFKRLGFKPASKAVGSAGAMRLDGTYGTICRALWIQGYHLGVFRDRTDKALVAFVQRQTGIAHLNWVRDPADGKKVVEALKGWISRATGIVWPNDRSARERRQSIGRSRKEAILIAQHRILGVPWQGVSAEAREADLDRMIADFGRRIRAMQKRQAA